MAKTALITGGAKRIGREIVLGLAESGYDIALHYFGSENDARDTESQVRELGRTCKLYKFDLAKENDLPLLINSVTKDFPDLELLINNASLFEKATIEDTEPDMIDRQFSVNFKAPFFLMRDFARRHKKGQIINILDARITQKDFNYSAYSLSKMALAELTKMAAVEFAPGIRVNGVAPGIILPPSNESIEYLDRKSKNVPLQRKGNISEIVNAVIFLTENDYVTGQIIFVDGGEHL